MCCMMAAVLRFRELFMCDLQAPVSLYVVPIVTDARSSSKANILYRALHLSPHFNNWITLAFKQLGEQLACRNE